MVNEGDERDRDLTTQQIQEQQQPNAVDPDVEVVNPERVPWSRLGQEFAETWGRADPSDPQPESMEVIGQNGSGKTMFMCKVCQERMLVRHTPTYILQSKPDDQTVIKLGWPIIANGDVNKAKKERWSVFWPQTNATGRARKLYQADKFRDMLNSLWTKNANCIVVLDDVGYIQGLTCSDGEPLNPIIEMYLREGRSCGITVVMLKQRPQGAKREMHSESLWTVEFRPKDEDDLERWAQLLGNKKAWTPIIKGLDMDKHEFIIKSSRTGLAVISWIDTPLRPLKRPERNVKQRA
jgi:hypothetical protein